MDNPKQEREILERAINRWENEGRITAEKSRELKDTLGDKTNDNSIAQYFFIIAISCSILAFGALFIDEKLLERFKQYFALSNIVITMLTAALSIGWYWFIWRRRRKLSPSGYEANLALGALAALTSLIYLCKVIGEGPDYSSFLLLATVMLFALSFAFQSRSLWVGGILALMGWFGTFSTWLSTNNLFLGMNYPVRFSVFGILVVGFALLQQRIPRVAHMQRITYITGLLILFTGLWGVSVFGNYHSIDEWLQVRQVHVLAFSILFAAAALASFYFGIKYKDQAARDFGILFLLVNLYTRYFEYFWDTMNKGIFFLVLAVTFGLLGRWLEKRRKTKNMQENIS